MDNLFYIVTIFAILIPLIFVVLLLIIRHPNRRAQYILIFGFIIAIIGYLFELLNYSKFYLGASIFFIFYIPIIFALYPVLFIYLKCIIWKDVCLSTKTLLKYFAVTLLATIILWAYYFPLPYEAKIKFLSYAANEIPTAGNDALIYVTIFVLYYLQAMIYIYAFTRIALYVSKSGKSKIIMEEDYLPQWVWVIPYGLFSYEVIMTISIFLFDLPSLLTMIIENFTTNMFFLFLGIFGLKQYDLSVQAKLKKLTNHYHNENGARKTSNKLSEAQKKNIIETIEKYVLEKKLYLDPNLKIEQLAKKAHVPHKNLSLVINELLGKSFTTMLNEYRIEEAKEIISNDEITGPLEEIYVQAGFNSRSTFNRVFKSITGLTPSDYKDSINQNS